jgi:hypothetical protein
MASETPELKNQKKSNVVSVDLPMFISALIFLVPGSIHWKLGERFEAFMYASVMTSSILSDALFSEGSTFAEHTTNLDRIVASSALFAAVRRGWLLRPRWVHRLLLISGISLAGMFLLRGRRALAKGKVREYRFNHIIWHICLTLTGLWSAMFRPHVATTLPG